MENYQIKKTDDGSNTIYSSLFDSTYHSIHGALAESEYVFIKNGLSIANENGFNKLEIFEMGFGTGLNALLSCEFATLNQIEIIYTAIDTYPLPQSIIDNISKNNLHMSILNTPWGTVYQLTKHFSLHKINIDLFSFLHQNSKTFDVIYYDAFGPKSQPDLWEDSVFEQLASILKPKGVFTTYGSKGSVKRALLSSGLEVKRLEGPPGKRHMLMALKPNLL